MEFARVPPDSNAQNASAMDLGNETSWHKAAGYVTREPYRSLFTAKLAHLRSTLRFLPTTFLSREALAKLVLARSQTGSRATAHYPLLLRLYLPGTKVAGFVIEHRPAIYGKAM
jgi:hypothetical protein